MNVTVVEIAAPVVLSNLIYLVGAVGVAVLISVIYVLWHRRPESTEDHMALFAKRLHALEALTPERDEPDTVERPRGRSALPGQRGPAREKRHRPATAPPRTASTSDAAPRLSGAAARPGDAAPRLRDPAPSQARGRRRESQTG